MSRHIDLGCDIGEVARLNAWLAEQFAEGGVPPKAAGNIKLCLNEAVTNTISYGFPDPAGAEIGIMLEFQEDSATATVVDNGIAFNPLDVPDAAKIEDLKTAQIGGFGIKLMREAASSISHERTGGRNRLTMTFLYG